VVGAGVIGASAAYALARSGRRVVHRLAPPGEGGASYGNAGHIATELIEPLPSPQLLFGFWRELFSLGGVLGHSRAPSPEICAVGHAVRGRRVSQTGPYRAPRAPFVRPRCRR
jgi:D-amino-acid dehydrogenase